jgi:hypothetical protein
MATMKKYPTSFGAEQYDWLVAEEERTGIGFSELVRRAVDVYRGTMPLGNAAPQEPAPVRSKDARTVEPIRRKA